MVDGKRFVIFYVDFEKNNPAVNEQSLIEKKVFREGGSMIVFSHVYQ